MPLKVKQEGMGYRLSKSSLALLGKLPKNGNCNTYVLPQSAMELAFCCSLWKSWRGSPHPDGRIPGYKGPCKVWTGLWESQLKERLQQAAKEGRKVREGEGR